MQLGISSLKTSWLKALLFTLFCYALLGRGFAYLYIGEMLAVIGFLIYLQTNRIMLLASNSVLLLWAMFAAFGFVRTLPFLGRYHFDAIRDAVLWGYGIFAVLIAAFVNTRGQVVSALRAYRKFLRLYLPLVPIVMLVSIGLAGSMPKIPWSNSVGIISLKAADVAVHLAAAGLFFMLFPNRPARGGPPEISLFGMLRFAGWLLAAVTVLIVSRGGFVAMAIPIGLVSALKPGKVGWKVVGLAVIGVSLSLMVLEANVITLSHHGRKFTSEEMMSNVGSILGAGHASTEQAGTKTFRIVWWTKIVGYTFFGPYRWTGKGFGINLAQSDDPPGITAQDTSLRSPHNGSMTVLARMGVPGIILWVAINGTFAFSMFRAHRMAAPFWSSVNLWIFCYWLASFINMSFDVYIEGPQGGIWFWSIIGFGVAALRIQAHERRQRFLLARRNASGFAPSEPVLVHA